VFVPSGWWHAVLNLTPTISVTENWAGHFNIGEIVQEIKRRPKTRHKEKTPAPDCLRRLRRVPGLKTLLAKPLKQEL
jgi:hypothetical protein